MARSRSGPKPKSDLKCRHCRAPNDLDAQECWLCQRRNWRGPRGIRSLEDRRLPERSPFAAIAGLPGPSGLSPSPGVRRDGRGTQPADPVEKLPGPLILILLVGGAWWVLKSLADSPLALPAAIGVAVIAVLGIVYIIFLGMSRR
jgi:hypothetical protein